MNKKNNYYNAAKRRKNIEKIEQKKQERIKEIEAKYEEYTKEFRAVENPPQDAQQEGAPNEQAQDNQAKPS